MPKFRKKPVEIEAVLYSGKVSKMGWPHEVTDAHPWLDAAYDDGILDNIRDSTGDYITIKTLEGVMRANPGEWIIRGVKGELYPCKPDIFAATYDAVKPA